MIQPSPSEMWIRSFFLSLLCVATVYCGSLCPPRENIYPCSCANVHQSKKIIHTVVHCHKLKDSRVLSTLVPALRRMQVDQFQLYDSFWGATGDMASLPTDWLTLLKIKEMEIVDTTLAPSFACKWQLTCRNSVTTRFTTVNSTSGLCTLCDTGAGKYPWTGCLSRLQHFQWTGDGSPSSILTGDAFPVAMKELRLLNMTRNRIARVDPGAFANLGRLAMLDLSRNAIESADFLRKSMDSLEFLDLSWNNIKTIGSIFTHLPSLKTLKIESNDIVYLKEADWKKAPESLKFIDLNDNPLHCDCSVRFVNGTFHVSSLVLGTCSTPDEYANSALRKASRALNQRCDEEGNIGTRKRPATVPAVTAPYLRDEQRRT